MSFLVVTVLMLSALADRVTIVLVEVLEIPSVVTEAKIH